MSTLTFTASEWTKISRRINEIHNLPAYGVIPVCLRKDLGFEITTIWETVTRPKIVITFDESEPCQDLMFSLRYL